MADGNDYNVMQLKEQAAPVEVVYALEGTPLISAPSGVLKKAPNPNAARLFYSWLHAIEAQQLLVDFACQHSVHRQTKEKPGRRKLSEIRLMQEDPAGVEKADEDIKARYAQFFKV
jgi:iron(III) transport system substrate-binding protein